MHPRVPALGVAALVMLGSCTSAETSDRAVATTTAPPTTATTAPPERADVEVTGPISGTPQTSGAGSRLDEAGYVEEEFFVAGTAGSFVPIGDLDDDGNWDVTAGPTAPYTTRILVKRPADPADASGVVVVEWNNVTVGADGTPDWSFTSAEMLRSGHVHIGVSAQKAGVDGTEGGGIGNFGAPLTSTDPVRYADLAHPGDPFSYDIFRQVGRLARNGAATGIDPLDGFPRQHIVAVGESQSAFRLTTYVNAVQPLGAVFDGFLVHSRGGGAAPLGDTEALAAGVAGAVWIRDDLAQPTLVFTTETDLTILGYLRARQPDSDTIVNWEVAGTAHADAFLFGGDPVAAADALGCPLPINDGPQHLVMKAALAALAAWVIDGEAPPTADSIETDDGAIARDGDGLAIGGIRLPAVEVPSGVLSGDPADDASVICSLLGTTTPFGPGEMTARYTSSDDYVAAVADSYDDAVAAGFALEADRQTAIAEARAVPFE